MKKSVMSALIKAAVCTTIASVYAGATVFFKDSFYFRTMLSDLKIGGKTVETVQMAIDEKGETFKLTLYGRGVHKDKLLGKDFQLEYAIKEDLNKLKEEQNAFVWPISIIKKSQLDVTEEVTFNEKELEEEINELSYFKESKVIDPVSARIEFNGVEFEIIPEVEGNKLNKEVLKETIIDALHNSKRVIDLEESGCYEEPKLRQDSKEVIEAKDTMNQYIQTEITYLFGSKEEKVTPEQISNWIELSDAGEVQINEDKIREYVAELDTLYSTLGKTRQFKSSNGNMATVSGGDYGWQISITNEMNAIIEALKSGIGIHREPIATETSQEYKEEDIGDSYVEINLTTQQLWFYKDGKLITSSGIVTGDQRRGYSTPQGVYRLKYKQRNAILNGPGYSTPVSFWMPFNGGIGLHDAVWRGSFGGTIYKNNGSHGCVNLPYNVAQAIYNGIDKSMPIICYY
ncbi:MAG: peptidoglycan-binding protein [Cellulosilyticum sp.]|nr:peptidoglycan-binding protein [Cellulosilyticum sp.]